MGLFNGTCPLSNDYIEQPNAELPIVGSLKLQWLLFYMASGFAVVSVSGGLLLAFRHLKCYVRPREQRQIVRIAWYPVIFAILNAFMIYDYGISIYLDPLSGLYEPIALTSLFLLFVEFSEPVVDNREHYFRTLQNYKIKSKLFGKRTYEPIPGGCGRWFQSKWVALFCYLIAFMVIKIIEIITQAAGRYCSSSYSLAFAHIYVIVISYIALPVGITAVLLFFQRMVREEHFTAHNPTMKLVSFKAVLLLSFFQQILFVIMTSTGAFKGTKTVTLRDFKIGIPALLVCFEQAVCSIWFHWSFSTREYKQHEKLTGEKRLGVVYAVLHALYPEDLFHGCAYAIRLMFKGVGPWGNGSWNQRKGGYNEVQNAADDVRLNRSKTFRGRQRGISNVSAVSAGSHASSSDEEMSTLRPNITPAEMEAGLTPGLPRMPRAHNADASSYRSRSRSPYGDGLDRAPSPYDPTRPYDSTYGRPYDYAEEGAPPQYLESNQFLPRSREPSPGR